jgi:adenosylcobyric acid synthase
MPSKTQACEIHTLRRSTSKQEEDLKHSRPIMFVGTGSDVGKSILAAGLCRLLKQDGYEPAPFKARNMSLNSYATSEKAEIGRAQAVQAEAAGAEAHTDMNPVLLKPSGEQRSQVVLHGKPQRDRSARSHFDENRSPYLFDEVLAAFKRLHERYDPIVIEGAGSISELNLKGRDITNMRVATATGASTYLVADIDKGGVFGSVYGTIALLEPEERERIKGIVINKFRGEVELFEAGKKKLEELTGVPVVGVIPFLSGLKIEEEDSVALDSREGKSSDDGRVNVAVVLLEHLSNFTDFDRLERDPRIHLYYTDGASELERADIIVLPGSKNTIRDMQRIREKGLAKPIIEAYERGKKVIGICGGYQMMGRSIEDPDGVEGSHERIPGLGLLPVRTCLETEKRTERSRFRFKDQEGNCFGYEIHMGRTEALEGLAPLGRIEGDRPEGTWLSENCWGTYLHGILDNEIVIEDLLKGLTERSSGAKEHRAFKEEQYDRLADHLRNYLDLEAIRKAMRS